MTIISYNSFTVVTFAYESPLLAFAHPILASFINNKLVSGFLKYENIPHMWKSVLTVEKFTI